MKTYYCLFLSLFLSSFSSFSLNIDSLKQIAQKSNLSKDWNKVVDYYYEISDTSQLRYHVEKMYQLALKENNPEQIGESFVYFAELAYEAEGCEGYINKNQEALNYFEKAGNLELQINALNNIANCYNKTGKFDDAIRNLQKARDLSIRFYKNEEKTAPLYINIAFAYLYKGLQDSSIVYNKKALKIAQIAKDTIVMIECNNNMGILYYRRNEFKKALEFYEKSLQLYELTNNKQKMVSVWCNIAVLYIDWKKFDKAIEFANKAIASARQFDASNDLLGISMKTLGIAMGKNGQYGAAIDTLKKAWPLVEGAPYHASADLLNISYFYYQLNELDSCRLYLDKAEKLLDEHPTISKADLFYYRGGLLLKSGKYREAIPLLENYVKLVTGKSRINSEVYNSLSVAYEESGVDIRKSLEYKKLAYNSLDSIYKVNANEKLNEFYAKYETTEKELEISRLNEQHQQMVFHRWLIIGGFLFLSVLLAIAWMYNRNLRLRKEKEAILLSKRMEEKEAEYQLSVNENEKKQTRSYLDGLEAERNRLSKELHDNVANQILSLEFIFRNKEQSLDDVSQILQKLHSNVRNISHDLMPPVFRYASLPETISDYCRMLNETSSATFNFEVHPDMEYWEYLPHQEALEIYRIVQEACGNIQKYADAKQVNISLIKEGEQIELIIDDDGIGMDMNRIQPNKGIGMQIMNERAESLKGQLSVISEPGKGTKVILKVKSLFVGVG